MCVSSCQSVMCLYVLCMHVSLSMLLYVSLCMCVREQVSVFDFEHVSVYEAGNACDFFFYRLLVGECEHVL